MPARAEVPVRRPAKAPDPGSADDLLPRTSFLNWAADEMSQLRESITGDTSREERFQVQNRIATLSAATNGYGQWLHRTSVL